MNSNKLNDEIIFVDQNEKYSIKNNCLLFFSFFCTNQFLIFQRHREQIKTWHASSDIKDKKLLLENRKLIELVRLICYWFSV